MSKSFFKDIKETLQEALEIEQGKRKPASVVELPSDYNSRRGQCVPKPTRK